jgi:hypothetical protein
MNLQEIKLSELNQSEILLINGGCKACYTAGKIVRDLIIGWFFS